MVFIRVLGDLPRHRKSMVPAGAEGLRREARMVILGGAGIYSPNQLDH
jgi:hypothetical protein